MKPATHPPAAPLPAADTPRATATPRARTLLAAGLLLLLGTAAPARADQDAAGPPRRNVPTNHEVRELAGWQVRIDKRLLEGEHKELGTRAINMLESQLWGIETVMPDKPLEQLREVVIQIDLDHDGLENKQYHPSAAWLRANGYSEDLEKVVHIARAERLVDQRLARMMPNVVLHELAHAYHDQVLGFDHPEILKHFEEVMERRGLEEVLHASGELRRHYALTDHKEWFAEMTEAYFGSNDFYPFVRAELFSFDPEGHDLLKEVWGDD